MSLSQLDKAAQMAMRGDAGADARSKMPRALCTSSIIIYPSVPMTVEIRFVMESYVEPLCSGF